MAILRQRGKRRRAAERVDIVIAGVDDLHIGWAAQAALACGELDVARRRADIASSTHPTVPGCRSTIDDAPAFVLHKATMIRPQVDAYEALTIANARRDTSLHRRHPGMSRSHGARRRKSLRSRPPTSEPRTPRGTAWDSSASKSSMTTTTRWYRHCVTLWATRISTRRGPRAPRCRRRSHRLRLAWPRRTQAAVHRLGFAYSDRARRRPPRRRRPAEQGHRDSAVRLTANRAVTSAPRLQQARA